MPWFADISLIGGAIGPSKHMAAAVCLDVASMQRLRCDLFMYDILMQQIIVAFGWRISIVDQVLTLLQKALAHKQIRVQSRLVTNAHGSGQPRPFVYDTQNGDGAC